MFRKKRNDRNHVIYMLTCVTTGDNYIGLTVARGRAYQKSAKTRFQTHVYRATVQASKLPLCKLIRKRGDADFKVSVLDVVRGKANAHEREIELIEKFEPSLNVLGKSI